MKPSQVVIPMAGSGERFSKAGFTQIKPLIEVDHKPMIEHVVSLFPVDSDFVFICREEHLEQTDLRNVLEQIAPNAKIVSVPTHNQGPVWSLMLASSHINLESETIVCYCDFAFLWSFEHFHNSMVELMADGAIVCYKGFHPHMLGDTQYAFVRHQEMRILEVREKSPFTDHRQSEFASNGLYYFRTGELLFQSIDHLLKKEIKVNGEYYVSLCFNELIDLGYKPLVYEVDNMLQWGTAQDLIHYQYWSDSFSSLMMSTLNQMKLDQTTLILLMSGEGKRFKNSHYCAKKPFILVNNKMMYQSALSFLPQAQKTILVANASDKHLLSDQDRANALLLQDLTPGQASSAYKALDLVDSHQHLLIAACDLGMVAQKTQLEALTQNSSTEIICFCTKADQQHLRNAEDYGWLSLEQGHIRAVGVKKKCEEHPSDYIISGTFWFKNKKIYEELYAEMLTQNLRVKNEFYIDTMIQLALKRGFNVKPLVLEACLNWGTPDDLRVYQYWQSVFSRKRDHPYSLELDPFLKSAE